MFTLRAANDILGGMRYVLKIFTALTAAVAIATGAVVMSASGRFNIPFVFASDNAKTDPAPFSYGYMMLDPVAAVCEGQKIYILDEQGNVYAFSDGEYSPVTEPVIKNEDNAPYDKLAVFGGNVRLYGAETSAAFSDDVLYVMTESKLSAESADGVTSDIVAPESGNTFTAGCANDGVVYMVEYTAANGKYSLWTFDGSEKNKLYDDLPCDERITGAAVTDKGEIYYSTLYSVYDARAAESLNNIGGGVTSLDADGNALVYTLASGKICRYENGVSSTVTVASDKIAVSSRHRTTAIADKGGNSLTVFRDGERKKITAVRPQAVAIGFVGNIFVASDRSVTEYGADLTVSDIFTFKGNVSTITDICVDRGSVDDVIYALSSDGAVYSTETDSALKNGVVAITAAPNGGFYALLEDGSAEYYSSYSSENADKTLTQISGAYDIAVDRADNVFRLAADGIYKNEDLSPVYEADGLSSFEISECEFFSDGYALNFGDVICVNPEKPSTELISGTVAGTDMKNGESYTENYEAFSAQFDEAVPNGKDYKADIRQVVVPTEVYPVPVESPSVFTENSERVTVAELPAGTYVTVIAQYEDTDFYYAITENRADKRSIKGYVNIDTLGAPEQYPDDEPVKAYVAERTSARKYPSPSAPVIDELRLEFNTPCTVMPFPENYVDANGDGWYRLAYEYQGETYDCYVKKNYVSLSGTNMGHNIDPDFNGDINCKEGAECYDLIGKEYVLNGNTLPDGQQIEILGTFTKSEEYTHVRYIDDEGETCECYVLTKFVRQTEAGIYQIVMFFVALIVAAFVILLIIVKVRKKNKID